MSKRVELGRLGKTAKADHAKLKQTWRSEPFVFNGSLHTKGHDAASGLPETCYYTIKQYRGRAEYRSRVYPYAERENAKAEAVALFEACQRTGQPALPLPIPDKRGAY